MDSQSYWKSLQVILSPESLVESEGEDLELSSEEAFLLLCSCPYIEASCARVRAIKLSVLVCMDSGHELPVSRMPKVEGHSPVRCEVVLHVLTGSCVLPAGSGFDVRSSKLPGFDSLWTEDVSVDLFECVPLEVGPFPVEGVRRLAMIEARNGFLDPSASRVCSSLELSVLSGLVGAVTGVGLVWPLPKWDWRDIAPSLGREGYVVPPKSSERVGVTVVGRVKPSPRPWSGQRLSGDVRWQGIDVFVLDVDVVEGEDGVGGLLLISSKGSLSVSWFPGARGVVRVVIDVRRCSAAPCVCCLLGSPYVPRRGAWVLRLVPLPGVMSVDPLGIVSGRELLPTRVVLAVGGGIPNRDRSPVKGTGRGRCASGCHVCGS